MSRKMFILLVLLALFSSHCSGAGSSEQSAKPDLKILPEPCELQILEKIGVSVQGTQRQGRLSYDWSASTGSILSLQDGVNAEYTAPAEPGDVTITVVVSDGDNSWTYSRVCSVVDPNQVLTETSPLVTSTSGQVTSTPLPTPQGNVSQIVLTEVMVSVCGGADFKRYNQYLEIYNNGDSPVDVSDLWIYAPNYEKRGQRLVAWRERNPDISLGDNLVLDSTILPPHGVAVILPPQYDRAPRGFHMPYHFPDGTIILTVDEGIRLGDNFYGLRAENQFYDVVILYQGGRKKMSSWPISTYGTPRISSAYLRDVLDNGEDGLPWNPGECSSLERIHPGAEDNIHNWVPIHYGSPGEYTP